MRVRGAGVWLRRCPACDHRFSSPMREVFVTLPAATKPRLLRDPANRVVAGVAAGLARHLGAPVLLIRIGFFGLALTDGLGAILYAVFWAVLPSGTEGGRRNFRQLVPFLALSGGIGLVHFMISGTPSNSTLVGWLAALVAVGAGIIWHLASPSRRQRWSDTVPGLPLLGIVLDGDRRSTIIRFLGGGLLVIFGLIGIIAYFSRALSSEGIRALVNGLIFGVLGLAGVSLALAPVIWRMFTQLRTERETAVRERERAEIAAMLHDQVLHTLALIQRSAGDNREVLRLARGQERSLRTWLYKGSASPSERFGAALEQVVAEIEDTYAIAVELVVVGDRQVDERVAAAVAAAREALVNCGRHAEVATVSVYAEVEDEQISVFVRDRGVGFDPGAVDDNRHGVRGSILGRMERHGGRAEIRSEPGAGTEVRLTMPLADPRRVRVGDWLGEPRTDAPRADPPADEPSHADPLPPVRAEPPRVEARRAERG
jgi:signal transduction histidine kinase